MQLVPQATLFNGSKRIEYSMCPFYKTNVRKYVSAAAKHSLLVFCSPRALQTCVNIAANNNMYAYEGELTTYIMQSMKINMKLITMVLKYSYMDSLVIFFRTWGYLQAPQSLTQSPC